MEEFSNFLINDFFLCAACSMVFFKSFDALACAMFGGMFCFKICDCRTIIVY